MSSIILDYSQVNHCPICESTSLEIAVDLPDYPLTEFVVSSLNYQLDFTLDTKLLICMNCSHGFLEKQINPRILYSDTYLTSSASTSSLSVFTRLITRREVSTLLEDKDCVVDIGANDGTLLKILRKKYPAKVLFGIDPIWSPEGLPETIKGHRGFFDSADALGVIPHGDSRLFIATHVLEHIENPRAFMKNLSYTMNSRDQALLVFPSLEALIDDSRFESIHHQHYHYFSYGSFDLLLQESDLYIEKSWIDRDHYGAACVLISKDRGSSQDCLNDWKVLSQKYSQAESCTFFPIFRRSRAAFMKHIDGVNAQLEFAPHIGLGAGALMSPILFYYLEPWSSFEALHDDDEGKNGIQFCNTPQPISITPSILTSKRVVILGSVSKLTGRKLFERACELNANTILFPTIGA